MDLYLSTSGRFSARGIAGGEEDVFVCRGATTGPEDCGGLERGLVGSTAGLGDAGVEAVSYDGAGSLDLALRCRLNTEGVTGGGGTGAFRAHPSWGNDRADRRMPAPQTCSTAYALRDAEQEAGAPAVAGWAMTAVMLMVAAQPDLWAARQQMALSLGWHIVIACFGVGFPALVVGAEALGIRRQDPDLFRLARRWSKSLAVLFAVGAVSGTILSFELGILWPGLMRTFGDVWGLPFAIEGIAFFIEAIFVGIYLYGWARLPPKVHVLTGVPIVIAGVASAWFVVTANAWMNQPRGFDVERYLATGVVADVDPWAAMFNPATPPQTTHMVLAAFMVAGFGTASVYAAALLRGRTDRYHRLGFILPFSLAAALTPIQIGVGDWAARFLATNQPIKLAALEGLNETQRGAPLTIGGLYVDGSVRYGIEIPRGLSLLAHHDPDAEVVGLETVPPDERPPVAVVRAAFQTMVAIGLGLLGLGAWFAIVWWRRRRLPRPRSFLWLAVAAGPLAAVALEAGWVATEVGRQPWIVYGVMRVEDAVTSAPGIRGGYYALIVVYSLLTAATVYVLRRLARAGDADGESVPPADGSLP